MAELMGIKKAGRITINVGESKGLGYTGVGMLFINGQDSFNQTAQIILPNSGALTVGFSSNNSVFGTTSDFIVQIEGGISTPVVVTNNWTNPITFSFVIF